MLSRALAFVLLLMLSPVLALIAIATRLTMGSPVLFRSWRGGQGGVPFELLKFRTMRPERFVGEQDLDRVTRLGAFLRSTSLDELPSLWNIACGEMVFVGPRPFVARYVPRYDAFQARRLAVKPGLTGWAQVNGRNMRTWQEKFELDVWYVDHRSAWLDARIIARTVAQVIRRADVVHGGEETMPEFDGTQ